MRLWESTSKIGGPGGWHKAFECDHHIWPLGLSKFYFGLVPPIPDGARCTQSPDARRTRVKIAMTWHNMLITFTARIWAEYKRSLRKMMGRQEFKKIRKIRIPTNLSYNELAR
ncbi:hypothetical protein PM082_000787 [Marasmius tenuissimus]|nr:hypothetical protein PM082_000787 [Marasmius tenuissimus]